MISTELWDAGTIAIREMASDGRIVLIAGFETNSGAAELLAHFRDYSPEWRAEPATDWIAETRASWPPRAVGTRLFLAPPWAGDPTPAGRQRVIHNPGLACGTGEHPCTQLALVALEKWITPGCSVVDIGTGSGILAIAALRLGAAAVGIDPDEAAIAAALENFRLNGLEPRLAIGSADCLADACSDVTVANINGTVLLSILDDLLRATRPGGWLILTGFPDNEAHVFEHALPNSQISEIHEWRCVVAKLS